MEQKNTQELSKKTFSDLLHDPSAISAADSGALESLVEKYPYSQLIRSFYTRSLAEENPAGFEKELTRAALFSPDRSILRAIIEDAGSFKATETTPLPDAESKLTGDSADEQRLAQEREIIATADAGSPEAHTEESAETEPENITSDAPVATEEIPAREVEEPVIEERGTNEIENILAAGSVTSEEELPQMEEEDSSADEPREQETDLAASAIEEPALEEEEPATEGRGTNEIENILAAGSAASGEDLPQMEEEDSSTDEIPREQETDLAASAVEEPALEEEPAQEEDELDRLIRQNIVPPDALGKETAPEPVIDTTEDVFRPEMDIAENISHNVTVDDRQKVSRYNDDKLPYSFLWWLNKTRKEHTENYQPYVSFQLDTSQSIKRNSVDQLSSQIIENIFHLQSPVDQFENAPRTVPFQVKRKEDHILEKFIREEPQIKPPNSDKLDTENKARKSAEDPNDLVSETLAQIYTDQMLFHKAIDTYKKLSLKFPEKSPYFADQIRELEKKIN